MSDTFAGDCLVKKKKRKAQNVEKQPFSIALCIMCVSFCTVKVKHPSEWTKGNTYLSGGRLRVDG